jgi:hypothetical protein
MLTFACDASFFALLLSMISGVRCEVQTVLALKFL